MSGPSGGTIGPSIKNNVKKNKVTHVYTKYTQHTYVVKNGRYEHNPNAKAHWAVSNVGHVRTIRTNINARFNANINVNRSMQYNVNNYNCKNNNNKNKDITMKSNNNNNYIRKQKFSVINYEKRYEKLENPFKNKF